MAGGGGGGSSSIFQPAWQGGGASAWGTPWNSQVGRTSNQIFQPQSWWESTGSIPSMAPSWSGATGFVPGSTGNPFQDFGQSAQGTSTQPWWGSTWPQPQGGIQLPSQSFFLDPTSAWMFPQARSGLFSQGFPTDPIFGNLANPSQNLWTNPSQTFWSFPGLTPHQPAVFPGMTNIPPGMFAMPSLGFNLTSSFNGGDGGGGPGPGEGTQTSLEGMTGLGQGTTGFQPFAMNASSFNPFSPGFATPFGTFGANTPEGFFLPSSGGLFGQLTGWGMPANVGLGVGSLLVPGAQFLGPLNTVAGMINTELQNMAATQAANALFQPQGSLALVDPNLLGQFQPFPGTIPNAQAMALENLAAFNQPSGLGLTGEELPSPLWEPVEVEEPSINPTETPTETPAETPAEAPDVGEPGETGVGETGETGTGEAGESGTGEGEGEGGTGEGGTGGEGGEGGEGGGSGGEGGGSGGSGDGGSGGNGGNGGGESHGGRIKGGTPGKDSVRKRLMPGEFVVHAKAAKRFAPLLEAINRIVPPPRAKRR